MSASQFSNIIKNRVIDKVLKRLNETKAGAKEDLRQFEKVSSYHIMFFSKEIIKENLLKHTNDKEDLTLQNKDPTELYNGIFTILNSLPELSPKLVQIKGTNKYKVHIDNDTIGVIAKSYGALDAFLRDNIKKPLEINFDIGHTAGTMGSDVKRSNIALARIIDALEKADTKSKGTKTNLLIEIVKRDFEKVYSDIHFIYNGDFGKDVDLLQGKASAKLRGKLSFTIPQSAKVNRHILGVIEKALVDDRFVAEYIAEGYSSKPFFKMIFDQLDSLFLGKPTQKEKTKVSKSESTKVRIKNPKKPTLKTAVIPRIRSVEGRFISKVNIKKLLEPLVKERVKQDMDKARYFKTLTGRFQKSVAIEDIQQSNTNILVKYNYMQYPYGVFEKGGRLNKPGREPSTIISKSIRQAAKEIVSNKFKVVPMLGG